jgi:hypothetical protein
MKLVKITIFKIITKKLDQCGAQWDLNLAGRWVRMINKYCKKSWARGIQHASGSEMGFYIYKTCSIR